MMVRLAFAVLCALCMTAAATAQKKLDLGDQGPGLDVEGWVNAESEDGITIEEGRVYLITFWSSHSRPCVAAVPLLQEYHERWGPQGLTVVAVTEDSKDEVERFVRRQHGGMTFPVAVDRRNSSARSWMEAAGLKAIPISFLVDRKGLVQHIGHPGEKDFDRILRWVLDDRYDALMWVAARPVLKEAEQFRRVKNWRMAFMKLDEVIAQDAHMFAPLQIDKLSIMLEDMKDQEQADSFTKELIQQYENDPTFLANLARYIAEDPDVPDDLRNLDLAMEAIEKAAGSTENQPLMYHMRALVHYHRGELDQAVQCETRAYFLARPVSKPLYRKTLDDYQAALKKSR